MPAFNLEDYEPVEERLKRFWADNPAASIETEIVHTYNNGGVIVRASIRDGEWLIAQGMAEEHPSDRGANQNCWVENAETSAIGRALANWKYSGDKRPSREEMTKAQGNVGDAATREGAESGSGERLVSPPGRSGDTTSPAPSGKKPPNFNAMVFYRAKEYAEANGLENPRGYSDKLALERFNKRTSRELTEQECKQILDELKSTGQREMAGAVATVQAGFGASEEPF